MRRAVASRSSAARRFVSARRALSAKCSNDERVVIPLYTIVFFDSFSAVLSAGMCTVGLARCRAADVCTGHELARIRRQSSSSSPAPIKACGEACQVFSYAILCGASCAAINSRMTVLKSAWHGALDRVQKFTGRQKRAKRRSGNAGISGKMVRQQQEPSAVPVSTSER